MKFNCSLQFGVVFFKKLLDDICLFRKMLPFLDMTFEGHVSGI